MCFSSPRPSHLGSDFFPKILVRGLYRFIPSQRMTKTERAEFIQTTLNRLYPNPAVPLRHKDSYTLLVAVLLSAQCTDKKVNEITPLLFSKADTPQKMLRLDPEKIREIIRPCGLSPAKSKAIWGLSKILVDKHGGEVPACQESLEELPGVGHKTASVVMIQAFGVPAFPVDTHIHRLAQRWKLSSGKNVVQTEKDLKKLFPEKSWAKLHLQIIYYGREHCSARGCDGKTCLICSTLRV
jgi:endonuclease III